MLVLIVSAIFMIFSDFAGQTKKISITSDTGSPEENNSATTEETQTMKSEDELAGEAEVSEEEVAERDAGVNADEESSKTEVVKENTAKEEDSKSEEVPKISGVIQKSVSWGYQSSSNRTIDTIVVHSSYNALGGGEYDVDKLIAEYKEYGVAPHYLIDRKGNTYQLVKDRNIAYHAGASSVPDGRTNVNNFSIGIEMMNTKTDEYTSAQYAALKELIGNLKAKYKIKYMLGHNQIAPGRKDDPWNFKWSKIE